MSRPAPGLALAVLAVALAALALLAGGPDAPGRTGVAELSAELASGVPVVDAVTVAEWIRDRTPLRIVDVRDTSSFIRFSVPTAVNVPFPELPTLAVDSAQPLVLYDDGDGLAVRSWLLLRRLGHPGVRIMDRGVLGWVDGVVSPVLPAGTPEEKARYQRVAAISRYFGGLPRIGQPPDPNGATARDAVQLLSRRGCY